MGVLGRHLHVILTPATWREELQILKPKSQTPFEAKAARCAALLRLVVRRSSPDAGRFVLALWLAWGVRVLDLVALALGFQP